MPRSFSKYTTLAKGESLCIFSPSRNNGDILKLLERDTGVGIIVKWFGKG